MTTRISTAAQSAACAAVVALVDGGPSAGTISIYVGTQPAGPDTAPTGALLAQFTCSDPAFTVSGAVATLDVTPALTDSGRTDGTAGWFRIADSTGAGVLDGKVTATGGDGQITLNTTSVTSGVPVEITSGTITMPAS
jgi:hypothetical protein